MSLACLSCHNVGRTDSDLRAYSLKAITEDERRWRPSTGCWSSNNSPRKSSRPQNFENSRSNTTNKNEENLRRTVSADIYGSVGGTNRHCNVGEGYSSEAESSPRLVRSHAVRRHIFRDFNFEDVSDDAVNDIPGDDGNPHILPTSPLEEKNE